MGVLFSKPATAESFEKALAAFDAQIRKVNIRLAELRPRETRALSSATLYGVAIWGILVALAFNTSLHTPQLVDLGDGDVVQLDPDKWKTSLMRLVVLSIGPILVYYLRRIVSWYFRRATEKSNELLEALRTQQRAKIEELKEITAFYRAKELIERYEYLLDPNAVPVPPSYFMEQQQREPDFQNQQQALAPQPPQSVAPTSSATPSIVDGPAPMLALEAPPLPDSTSTPAIAGAPTSSGWFAPLIDRLVAGGPETPDSESNPPLPPELTQYALICGMCFHHNGLALPNEFPAMVYVCRHCATLNDRGAMARGETRTCSNRWIRIRRPRQKRSRGGRVGASGDLVRSAADGADARVARGRCGTERAARSPAAAVTRRRNDTGRASWLARRAGARGRGAGGDSGEGRGRCTTRASSSSQRVQGRRARQVC
ncbi:hypothetical protein AMAG_04919 [Allomyces macrogynus ATCC 38327]|uniref:Endoplasmic reticulum junction formation protein lunapark n=1 Tax=Allomyces macrogynus (strain ATCC 38327) TaxID=578462 RepID=A0A0L0S6Z6_ALLM3|nr:hypothetical protein AMAG_04919 [Allomyces macrogynus ATCC 38327]|eukprot:KNE58099.1 hypothetical protein AMAG_04919 [Allomyces macrogynus ATCC 38327]